MLGSPLKYDAKNRTMATSARAHRKMQNMIIWQKNREREEKSSAEVCKLPETVLLHEHILQIVKRLFSSQF